MRSPFALFLLFFFFASFPLMAQYTTEEGNAARSLWLKGFEIYERGESAEKTENKKTAATLYQDALTYFQKVKTQYPKWNSALVEYRLKVCERKIQTLQGDTAPEQPAATGTTPSKPADPDKELKLLKDKIATLEKQARETQNRLDLTLLSLNEARKEAALGSKSKEEIQSLMKEKNDLEKKYSLIADENKRLQDDKDKKSDDSKWNEKIEAERKISQKMKEDNAALSAKNDELKAQSQKVSSEKIDLDYKMTKLTDSQKTFDDKLSFAEKALEELDTRLKASEKGKTAAEGELKDVQSKFEKQKQENEILSKKLKDIADNPLSSELAKQLQADNDKLKQDIAGQTAKMEKDALEKAKQNEEAKASSAKLEKVEAILIETKSDNVKYVAELENLRKKIADSDNSTSTYQNNIKQLSDENKTLKIEVNSLAASMEKLGKKEKELADSIKQCAILDELNRKLTETNAATVKENETLQTSLATETREFRSKLVKADKDRDAMTAKNVQAVGELEARDKELAAKSKEFDAAKAELETKAKDVARYAETAKKYQELQNTSAEMSVKNAELVKLNAELSGKQAELNKAGEANSKSKDELKKKIDDLTSELSKKNEVISQKEQELKTAVKSANTASEKSFDDLKKQLSAKTEEASKLEKDLRELKFLTVSNDKIRIERDELKMKISQKSAEIDNLKKASEQMKNEKTVTVEKVIKEVVKENAKPVNEDEVKLLVKSGEESEKKGNKEAAIWHYEKVLALDPENQFALMHLGLIYSDRGDDAMTLKYIERALCYQPYDVQMLLIAAFAYIRKGDYYLALGVLSRAAALDPKNPELQRYLGVACSNLGWVESAERQFRTAFELDPKSSETAFNLAVLLATSETPKMDEARKWYKKAKELGAETDPGMEKLFKE